jgi:uncharacterized protein YgiM (DUF1202 family)
LECALHSWTTTGSFLAACHRGTGQAYDTAVSHRSEREISPVLGLIILSLFPGIAEKADAALQATVIGESVAVHSQVSRASQVLKSLKRGETVKVELSVAGSDGEWCLVRESGKSGTSGYVLCQQIEEEPQPSWQEVPPSQGQATQSQPASRPAEVTAPALRWNVAREVRELRKVIRGRTGGDIPLIQAVATGDLPAAVALLAKGAKVNESNRAGETALMFAAENGFLEVVRALLAAGSIVDARNIFQETALILATGNGHVEAVRALAAAGADVNARDEITIPVLAIAAAGRHTSTVQALLAAGADVNGSSNGGYTALIAAARNGDVETVRVLLKAGANVNLDRTHPDARRLTALLEAKANGSGEVVRLLSEAGARE